MREVVFLLEEKSMQVFLEGLLPRLYPGMVFRCIPHEGKQDLDKSIPRKLRAWGVPARFVVVRDNDGADCIVLKERLLDRCREGRRDDTIVRIACQELEAWYFGDIEALVQVYGAKVAPKISQARQRKPDDIGNPARELERIAPGFHKVRGARQMAQVISPDRSNSPSFRALLKAVEPLYLDQKFSQ